MRVHSLQSISSDILKLWFVRIVSGVKLFGTGCLLNDSTGVFFICHVILLVDGIGALITPIQGVHGLRLITLYFIFRFRSDDIAHFAQSLLNDAI